MHYAYYRLTVVYAVILDIPVLKGQLCCLTITLKSFHFKNQFSVRTAVTVLHHTYLIGLQVFFGLLKEPEFDVPLDDEDEEGENEEGKPKKKKPKKDSVGSKSKKQDPNAPPQNRYQGNDV